jgi:hypothetical protein
VIVLRCLGLLYEQGAATVPELLARVGYGPSIIAALGKTERAALNMAMAELVRRCPVAVDTDGRLHYHTPGTPAPRGRSQARNAPLFVPEEWQ